MRVIDVSLDFGGLSGRRLENSGQMMAKKNQDRAMLTWINFGGVRQKPYKCLRQIGSNRMESIHMKSIGTREAVRDSRLLRKNKQTRERAHKQQAKPFNNGIPIENKDRTGSPCFALWTHSLIQTL